jgi:ribonuclease HI
MAKKYYVVKIGITPGIYESWEECQKQVLHYPKAEYKSFSDLNQAQDYLNGSNNQDLDLIKDLNDNYLVAYTDGSYNMHKQLVGYGAVLFHINFDEPKQLHGSSNEERFLKEHNISGEVLAVLMILEYAKANLHTKVKIYHDLAHLGLWYNGTYKANSNVAQYYLAEIAKYSNISLSFVKVKGHSNNKYNELADKLAKLGSQIITHID